VLLPRVTVFTWVELDVAVGLSLIGSSAVSDRAAGFGPVARYCEVLLVLQFLFQASPEWKDQGQFLETFPGWARFLPRLLRDR
jgi:hypothetical protein